MSEKKPLPADRIAEDQYDTEQHMPDQGGADERQTGDFRGPYGYGRPAYKPDPDATYSFEPGPRRTLALDPRRRWR